MILSRFPFPLEKGDKLRAYYQLADLSKHFEIHLICTTDSPVSDADREKVLAFCKSIHIFRLRKILILFSLLRAVFGQKPFQVRYFYQHWIQRKVSLLLKDIRPEHIYCQLVRASEYVKHYHDCPKTLDYMDALSKGMERRVEHASAPKKWLFRIESKRLGKYERHIFDYFENQTIISAQDRNYILHPQKDSIVLIPNGVDQRFFESAGGKKQYKLVFTGNMGYPPNVEAAHYIKDEILPLLTQDDPHFNCLIAGASPHPSLQHIDTPNFHVSGWVEDMRDSYRSAEIFVAPMMIGTGLQNKLLEAMAMGLPCITTTLANNALMAVPGKHILIADTAPEFARQVQHLLTSRELFESIATAGRNFVKEHYQWEKANEKLVNLIGSRKYEHA